MKDAHAPGLSDSLQRSNTYRILRIYLFSDQKNHHSKTWLSLALPSSRANTKSSHKHCDESESLQTFALLLQTQRSKTQNRVIKAP